MPTAHHFDSTAKRVGFSDEDISELSTTFGDGADEFPELQPERGNGNGGPPVDEDTEIEEEVAA